MSESMQAAQGEMLSSHLSSTDPELSHQIFEAAEDVHFPGGTSRLATDAAVEAEPIKPSSVLAPIWECLAEARDREAFAPHLREYATINKLNNIDPKIRQRVETHLKNHDVDPGSREAITNYAQGMEQSAGMMRWSAGLQWRRIADSPSPESTVICNGLGLEKDANVKEALQQIERIFFDSKMTPAKRKKLASIGILE